LAGARTRWASLCACALSLTLPAIALAGSGAGLSAAPGTLSFGKQDVDEGATAVQESTLTNSGTEAVVLSSLSVSGDFSQVAGGHPDCVATMTLEAGGTCTLRVRFNPASTGQQTGAATVSTGSEEVTIDLSGTGTQTALGLTPAALDFGWRHVGAGPSDARESTVLNTGTERIKLSNLLIKDPGAARFLLLRGGPADCVAGTALEAGEGCKVRVVFYPLSGGLRTARVTFTSRLPKSTIELTGWGQPPPRLMMSGLPGRASSTASKRLKLKVAATRGTVKDVVVSVRTRTGKVLGRATVGDVRRALTVTLRLTKPLAATRYVALARGRDTFRNPVSAKLGFSLR
jgi:hypothetical protein